MGEDGNIWFALAGEAKVGKIDPNNGNYTEAFLNEIRPANDIVTGPDGNLWMTWGSLATAQ